VIFITFFANLICPPETIPAILRKGGWINGKKGVHTVPGLQEAAAQPFYDVLHGRREEILQRRKEMQILTINRRKDYNQNLREFANAT